MQKLEYRYGLYGGIAICLFKIIEFLPSFQKARIESGIETGLFALVIAAAFVIFGVKAKRTSNEHSAITFLQAFIIGMIITVLIAFICVPFVFVYGSVVNTKEANAMIEYIKENPGDYEAPSEREIHLYYSPTVRAKRTAKDLMATGFLAALISAGMFRRVLKTMEDFRKDAALPTNVRGFFAVSMIVSLVPLFVYFLWLLKVAHFKTLLFEVIFDPLDNPLALPETLGGLALIGLALNFVSYKRIEEFRIHSLSNWNLRMMLVSIILIVISLLLVIF